MVEGFKTLRDSGIHIISSMQHTYIWYTWMLHSPLVATSHHHSSSPTPNLPCFWITSGGVPMQVSIPDFSMTIPSNLEASLAGCTMPRKLQHSPISHTMGNPHSQLWKESRLIPCWYRPVSQRCVETTLEDHLHYLKNITPLTVWKIAPEKGQF